mgnify:CR=1 FL=1
MKTITSTHYNRPTCTKLMLDHLAKCDGIEDYKVICCVEPVNDIIPDLIESHPLNTELVVNDRLLGLWSNKKKALSLGFGESDYVIHVEDDILLSKDSLSMFESCYNLKDDETIFTVTAFGRFEPDDNIVPDNVKLQVNRNKWYTPWGWATWKDRWNSFKDEWDGHDQILNHEIRGDRFEVYPQLSRVKSVGYLRGEYINTICDEEIFKVIRDNPEIMKVYGCHNEQDILNHLSKYKLKLDDGVEIIKRNDSNAGTKSSKTWKEDGLWAGDYEIPEGDFEFTWK